MNLADWAPFLGVALGLLNGCAIIVLTAGWNRHQRQHDVIEQQRQLHATQHVDHDMATS